MNEFGALLRKRRVEADKTLREVAAALKVSHVFLGEVERGTRPALKRERWGNLIEILPSLTIAELEAAAEVSKPIRIDVANKSRDVQDLAVLLNRRITDNSLQPDQISALFRVLRQAEKKGTPK